MAQIFISYASPDDMYAYGVYHALRNQGYSVWLAPFQIRGGQDFAEEIARALGWERFPQDGDELGARLAQVTSAQAVVLLLSRAAMESVWVPREVSCAVSDRKAVIPLKIDRTPLRGSLALSLQHNQCIPAYRLPSSALQEAAARLEEEGVRPGERPCPGPDLPRLIPLRRLAITSIAAGDPYYLVGQDLRVSLREGARFFLCPPAGEIPEDRRGWAAEHFRAADDVFGGTLADFCAGIGDIPDLAARIEAARRRVFRQFLTAENGTYYNNGKFGVYHISPFLRTEDLAERACLELELYATDYFTHRTMKEVCKELYREGHPHLRAVSWTHLGRDRIFCTSLGINLLLLSSRREPEQAVILCDRSANASETYGRVEHALSAIEGVSMADYEPFPRTVLLDHAAARGLEEELGIRQDEGLTAMDTLRVYQLFVNETNLEIGLACSVELQDSDQNSEEIRLEDLLSRHGKDEELEVAGKRVLPVRKLRAELLRDWPRYMPQAAFTIGAYLEAGGAAVFDRRSIVPGAGETFVQRKDGGSGPCGDAVFRGEHFLAVIDGATPKGARLWNGLPADAFAAGALCRALEDLPPRCAAAEGIAFLNDRLAAACAAAGASPEDLPPEERPEASIVIASAARREVWVFGDCKLRINDENYDHPKKIDEVLAGMRALSLELARLKGAPAAPGDPGRALILPYLKEQPRFANRGGPFGYDVLNGAPIRADRVRVYPIAPGDHVVLASDGYPRLFDTLAESEDFLARALREDPDCTGVLMGTKGLAPGAASYDDRAFLSFWVR